MTRGAIEVARSRGHQVVAALLVGGIEKLRSEGPPDVGVPVRAPRGPIGPALVGAIRDLAVEIVLDLSDEPVLGYRERMEAVAATLAAGATYRGPDFMFTPPTADPAPVGVPTVAVIGTGKRTGKTAIAGEVARRAAELGLDPVVVAMGRGGPAEPQVVEAGTVTLERLLSVARAGGHAASDYLEDALTTGVTTIGARRAGGGLAGEPYDTNVAEAVALAAARRPGVLVLEGSGAALPPIAWDAGILVVPVTCPLEYLRGYLGPYRLLRTDVAIVTMMNDPALGSEDLSALTSHLRAALGEARYVVTDFSPVPLADVAGRDVFLTTTAPGAVAARHAAYLADAFGCRVVGWSARLADRAGLAEDLDSAPGFEVLLTELKAAAIDVASERAVERGAEVVFVDNRARTVGGETELVPLLSEAIGLAMERSKARGSTG
ncbi:MAG TPA: 2,3-diphosphoglycerate synthetase [Actinomycetota bacterium]